MEGNFFLFSGNDIIRNIGFKLIENTNLLSRKPFNRKVNHRIQNLGYM